MDRTRGQHLCILMQFAWLSPPAAGAKSVENNPGSHYKRASSIRTSSLSASEGYDTPDFSAGVSGLDSPRPYPRSSARLEPPASMK